MSEVVYLGCTRWILRPWCLAAFLSTFWEEDWCTEKRIDEMGRRWRRRTEYCFYNGRIFRQGCACGVVDQNKLWEGEIGSIGHKATNVNKRPSSRQPPQRL